MYRYDETDRALVTQRVEQFRDQTRRYLAGELTEDEFRALRLRNGLYQQRFAPMLRISVPYGLLESRQLRQFVALHTEFYWLPRKFKFAFTGAAVDRAASRTNDVAVHLVRRADGAIGYRFYVGGGLGRQPLLAQEMNSFVPESDLLRYACAVLREWGIGRFRAAIEEEYAKINASVEGEELLLLPQDIERMRGYFTEPAYRPAAEVGADVAAIAAR